MKELYENDGIHKALGLFIHTNRLHMKALDREVGAIGLHRGQHMMLMTISGYEGSAPSQTELASRLNISTAAVTVVLKKLEKAGYIRRDATDSDNRCNKIFITEKGREIVTQSQKHFTETAEVMFEGFSEDELNKLTEYLERLHGNLAAYINKSQKGEAE